MVRVNGDTIKSEGQVEGVAQQARFCPYILTGCPTDSAELPSSRSTSGTWTNGCPMLGIGCAKWWDGRMA